MPKFSTSLSIPAITNILSTHFAIYNALHFEVIAGIRLHLQSHAEDWCPEDTTSGPRDRGRTCMNAVIRLLAIDQRIASTLYVSVFTISRAEALRSVTRVYSG